jgi:hypothetical protein
MLLDFNKQEFQFNHTLLNLFIRYAIFVIKIINFSRIF